MCVQLLCKIKEAVDILLSSIFEHFFNTWIFLVIRNEENCDFLFYFRSTSLVGKIINSGIKFRIFEKFLDFIQNHIRYLWSVNLQSFWSTFLIEKKNKTKNKFIFDAFFLDKFIIGFFLFLKNFSNQKSRGWWIRFLLNVKLRNRIFQDVNITGRYPT